MKKYLIAAALMSAMGFANATPFETLKTDNNNGTNGSWSFGTLFTVGANNMTVTSLGAFDANKDGFVSSAIQVGIFNAATNALIASANVVSSNILIGDYRYANIAPLTLLSGVQYRLVAVSGNDAYNYDAVTATFNSAYTNISYGYCSATSLTACSSFTESNYGMANFQSQAGGTVPEPGSLALLGLGLAGFAAVRRRKQA